MDIASQRSEQEVTEQEKIDEEVGVFLFINISLVLLLFEKDVSSVKVPT